MTKNLKYNLKNLVQVEFKNDFEKMFGGNYIEKKLPRDELFFRIKADMETAEQERKERFKAKKMGKRFLPDVAKTVKQETAKIREQAETLDNKLRDREKTAKMKKELEEIKRKEKEDNQLFGRRDEDED